MITYPEELEKMKKSTPARIGIGHTGARYTTSSALSFWADQSKAADAVFSEVPQSVIQDLGVLEVHTKCQNKYEIADFLDVTEEYLQECINCYQSKYGICTTVDNYVIYFVPYLTVTEMI